MRKFHLATLVMMILLLSGSVVNAQDFSNKGKEFWLAYSYHVGMINSQQGLPVMTLYITSDVSTTYNVEIYGVGSLETGAINAGQVKTVVIPSAYFINNDGLFTNRAIRVTAAKPIVVYSYITRSAASGATLCLPTPVLGREYVSMNYKQLSNETNSNSYITIVAVEDNTNVEITVTANTKGGWLANTTHTVSLNKGQVYQVLGQTAGNNGEDLTGSVVRSVASSGGGCKKIAVFSGSGKISIGCIGGSSDNLYQQLYPVASWGKKYLTIPSYNRPNAIYRVAKSDPAAKVFLNGALIPSASFTNNVYEFTNTIPNQIESDQPICVAQYFTTQGPACAGNDAPYDPDMIILNPLEQNIDKVTLVSSNLVATLNRQHHLHVIIKNSGTALSSFKLDGNPVPTSQWVTHPANSAYSYIYFSNVTQGYHTLASDTGFNALAYGYADAETYGYSAGSSIKDLYQFISVDNQFAQVNIPATCKNMPFSLSMTFPYEPTQIIWQFNGLYPDVTINSPVYDESSVVNGKTLYKYKLTGSYTAPGAGSYPIKIVAQNPTTDGCSGVQEIEYDLQVFDPPVAEFNFTNSGCITIPVNFTDNTTNPSGRSITHRHWNFGDATVQNDVAPTTHTYATPGSYEVKYTVITDVGCKSVDTAKHTVVLNNSPVADFTVTPPVCIGKAITFKDASTGTNITKWVWNFGDGPDVIATTNADQTHTYAGNGPYNVTLKVVTASGCESVVFGRQVILNPNPAVNFTLPTACVTKVAAFNSTSTISDGTESQFTYAWDFGDASPVGAGQSPSHTYANPGPFDVKLTVTSNNGCISSVTKPLTTIYPAPAAAFTVPADACVGTAVNFTDGSTVTGGTITEWHWDFGDMTSSAAQNPSKTYSTPGVYTVTLSVKSAQGCESAVVASHQVDVKAPPVAGFTVAAPYCTGKTIVFTDASSGTGISKWVWNFGDGSPVVTATTNANQTHTYTGTGPFTVTLQVETASGCQSTVFSKIITVNPEPVVSFTLPTACISEGPGAFSSTSTISDGTESQFAYAWDFGDGSPVGSGQSPSHTYTNTGPFDVKLTVTSNNGCVASLTKQLTTIYAEPVATFTAPAEVCAGTAVNFTDGSTVSGSTITGWQWDFGDMTSSTDRNPVKTYNTPGPYTVKLTVTSAQGCRSITTFATHPITVNVLPVADFNVLLPGCVNQAITLEDASSINSGSMVKWSWDFGDGNTAVVSTNAPANHTYTSTGSFTATLQVESDKGCKSTVVPESVVISPLPAAIFTPPVICVTDPAAFTDASTVPSGSIASWQWNFGDATFSTPPGNSNTSAAQNPSHQYSQPGDYTVQLTVTSNAGCQHTVSHLFTVNAPPVSAFTIENTGPGAFCSNKQVSIKDASRIDAGNIIRVEIFWDETGDITNKTVDNSPAIGKVYTHTYPEFGSPATKTYRIRYDVYSGTTCVSTVRDQVTLLATPTLTFATLDAVCSIVPAFDISTNVQLLNGLSGSGAFSGTGVSSAGLFTPSGASTGTNMLTYTYTADNGCVSTVQQPLVVNPTPIANAGPDRVVLEGGVVTLTPTLITTIPVSYTWTPSTGLSNPAIATPGASPATDQLYTLTVTSDKGCTTSDNVFVKLLLAPVIPNIFSPNGDGIHDRWVIEFLDSYPGCVVQIFNRYGQPIYRVVNYTTPWDGKVSGKDVPVGTYYYIIDPKNGRKPITGYIDIIR